MLRILLMAAFATGGVCVAQDLLSCDLYKDSPGSTTTVGADGFNIAGKFRLTYRQMQGDFDVRARIDSFSSQNDGARMGITVRQDLDSTGVIIQAGLNQRGEFTFVSRSTPKGKVEVSTSGLGKTPNVWLRLERKGREITGSYSNDKDGGNWQQFGTITIQLTDPVFVGMQVYCMNAQFRSVSFQGSAALAGADPARPAPRASPATPGPEAPAARAPGEPAMDREMARAFAVSAAKLAADGKFEKAQELCFKALAYDDSTPVALFELGKMMERNGDVVNAANFLARAAQELMRQEAATPAYESLRKEADRRVLALNPAASQLRQAMSDYSEDLAQITRKLNDALTHDEVADRMQALSLEKYVEAEKLPKTPNRTMAAAKPAGSGSGGMSSSARGTSVAVSPDIEKAMKAAGWQTVSGQWKKVGENVYEVTDGRLESKFKNGVMQAVIQNTQTTKGTVRMLVRNGHGNNFFSTMYTYGSGYGLSIDKTDAVSMIPYGMMGNRFMPIEDKGFKLDFPTKNQFQISVTTNTLEYNVNGKRVHRSNYAISDEGPFSIEMKGTVTIENPQVKGN